MGIVIGVVVLLVSGYLLAAALQHAAMIKPYAAAFAFAGLTALAALGLANGASAFADWLLLAAKLVALLSCLALSLHLAVLVVRQLLVKGKTPR